MPSFSFSILSLKTYPRVNTFFKNVKVGLNLVIATLSLAFSHPSVAWYLKEHSFFWGSWPAMDSLVYQVLLEGGWLSPLLSLLGLSALLRLVRDLKPLMSGVWTFLVMGLVFRLWLQWLADSPYLEPLAGVAAMAVAGLLAFSISLWALALRYMNLKQWPSRLLAALSWSLLEWSRQYWFCGFPWYPLGICWLEALPSLYGWLGPMGSSIPLVWVALEMVYCKSLRSRVEAPLKGLAVLGLICCFPFPIERMIDLQAAVVHSELPVHHFHVTYSSEAIARHLRQKLPDMDEREGAYRFLVTSEGLFPDSGSYFQLLEQGQSCHLWPSKLAYDFQGYLILGIEDDWSQRNRVTNSLWAFSKEGRLVASYAKRKLMPFAEYFPLASFPILGRPLQALAREYGILDALDEGIGDGLLELPGLKVALSICFEETFISQLQAMRRKGAQLWISSSNDGWYPQSVLGSEHALHARMLAATMGMPLLRSTQMGLSGLIDGKGAWRVRRGGPQAEVIDWLTIDTQVEVLRTPFNYVGAWPMMVLWLSLGLMGFLKRGQAGLFFKKSAKSRIL